MQYVGQLCAPPPAPPICHGHSPWDPVCFETNWEVHTNTDAQGNETWTEFPLDVSKQLEHCYTNAAAKQDVYIYYRCHPH